MRKVQTKSGIEDQCRVQGIVSRGQRRFIAQVIAEASDHPDIPELHRRVRVAYERIALSTVYRALEKFEAAGIIVRHKFRGRRPRYEMAPERHHDHLVNIQTGAVIDFQDQEIESMLDKIARASGLRLVDHRLVLYVVPMSSDGSPASK